MGGVFDIGLDSGIEHGRELATFAGAVLASDLAELDASRQRIAECMGLNAVVSASIIAGDFSLVDRAANGIGISVEPMALKPTEDFREQYGINQYPSAANTLASA